MNANMILASVATRLMVDAGLMELAMKPYKPKTPSQLKLKNDIEHRKQREAYKHRDSGTKMKDEKYRENYYRKNKGQLKIRQKKSRQLHKKPTAVRSDFNKDDFAIWCCSYRTPHGLFSLNMFGTYSEALSHAANLELSVDGKLEAIIPASMNGNSGGLDNLGKAAEIFTPGYGTRATTSDTGKFSDPADKRLFS